MGDSESFHSTPPPIPSPKRSGKRLVWFAVLISAAVVVLIGGTIAIVGPATKAVREAIRKSEEKRKALREIDGAVADAKNQLRDAFDEENGFSMEKGAAAAAQIQKQLEKAAKNLSGDDAQVTLATRNWLASFQSKGVAYNQLLQEIEVSKLLDLREVDRAVLAERRKNVERMLTANAELSNSIRSAERDFESELVKLNVSPKMRHEALDGFREGARRKHEFLLKIRAADQTLGEAALQLFDLMEREWGKWNFDEEMKIVRFESDQALNLYQELMERIQKASTEQIDAQRQIVQ